MCERKSVGADIVYQQNHDIVYQLKRRYGGTLCSLVGDVIISILRRLEYISLVTS